MIVVTPLLDYDVVVCGEARLAALGDSGAGPEGADALAAVVPVEPERPDLYHRLTVTRRCKSS